MSAGILLLSLGLPMTTSSASSRSVRTLASASSSGTRPFIGDVGAGGGHEAAGHARDLGHRAEDLRVDADGHDVQPVLAARPSARRCRARLDSDTVTTRGIAPRDLHLHAEERRTSGAG